MIILGAADAATRRGQVLAWATVNQLLRCYGVFETVTVHCPDVALAAELPNLSGGTAPGTLHQVLANLAAATADPERRGPRLAIQPTGTALAAKTNGVTLVLGTEYADSLASIAEATAGPTWLVTAGAWKLCISTPAALVGIGAARLPCLDEADPISVAAWLASALACAEAFKHVGELKDGRGRMIEAFSVNLWTLTGSDGFAELGTPEGPITPPAVPAHYVAGAGAVAEGYLTALATSDVSAEIALLDDDILDETNLNRHILAAWSDLGTEKAPLAHDRLTGSRTRIFPITSRWGDYVAIPPTERPARPQRLKAEEANSRYGLVISAVDRDNSRISIAASRPDVVLGGSTNGLAVEIGRYQAGSKWQCLACASRPGPEQTIEEAAKDLAAMTESELEAVAEEQCLDLIAITSYLQHPRCGTLGEREVQRFAAFAQPDWSVSFVSVASGALLAARMLSHVGRDDTEVTDAEGDTLRLWLGNATLGRTAHRRRTDCSICGHR
jgi:hypothetical protein